MSRHHEYGPDPRNTAWANDKGRFGFAMMQKMGWKENEGLGARGEGLKTHIKAERRLDNRGLGAKNAPESDWSQGTRDLQGVLARLAKSRTPPPPETVATEHTEEKTAATQSEPASPEQAAAAAATVVETAPVSAATTPAPGQEEGSTAPPQKRRAVEGVRPGRMLNMKNVRAKLGKRSQEDMACIFGASAAAPVFPVATATKKEVTDADGEAEKTGKEEEEALSEIVETKVSTKSTKDYFSEKLKAKAALRS